MLRAAGVQGLGPAGAFLQVEAREGICTSMVTAFLFPPQSPREWPGWSRERYPQAAGLVGETVWAIPTPLKTQLDLRISVSSYPR